jgi:hypothetical protein
MGQIETDKKLELVRAIRMSQLNNRALLNGRERLLYGHSPIKPPVTKGELYSLEVAALEGGAVSGTTAGIGSPFRSFKLRMIAAVVLFALFVFWDRTEQNIAGVTSVKIYELVNDKEDMVAGFINNLLGRGEASDAIEGNAD